MNYLEVITYNSFSGLAACGDNNNVEDNWGLAFWNAWGFVSLNRFPWGNDKPMSMSSRGRLAKIIRVVARVIGLSITAYILFASFAILIWGIHTVVDVLILVSFGINLVTNIISWWRVGFAGIVMILSCIGMGVFVNILSFVDFWWGIVFLPWLVSGILFLLSRWLSRA